MLSLFGEGCCRRDFPCIAAVLRLLCAVLALVASVFLLFGRLVVAAFCCLSSALLDCVCGGCRACCPCLCPLLDCRSRWRNARARKEREKREAQEGE